MSCFLIKLLLLMYSLIYSVHACLIEICFDSALILNFSILFALLWSLMVGLIFMLLYSSRLLFLLLVVVGHPGDSKVFLIISLLISFFWVILIIFILILLFVFMQSWVWSDSIFFKLINFM